MAIEERISITEYLTKGLMFTTFALVTRRHLINSFVSILWTFSNSEIYQRKYEKWVFYIHSYEKRCILFKNLIKQPYLLYPTAIFTYEILSYLLDYSFKELIPAEISRNFVLKVLTFIGNTANSIKVGIKSSIFCNIFSISQSQFK
jgi:hypothetical protein